MSSELEIKKNRKEKIRVAISSLFVAVWLVITYLIVGMATGSLAIISEAFHAIIDIVATAITLLAVIFSDKPADKEHTYGHGKIENISALAEAVLLVGLCVWVYINAFDRIINHDTPPEINTWSFIVVSVAIILGLSRSIILFKMAKKHDSQALKADAWHFTSDVLNSVVIIVGFVLIEMGMKIGDAVASIIVATIIMFAGIKLAKNALDELMDKIPKGLYDQVLGEVLDIPNVNTCENLRLRKSGSKTYIDMTVNIDKSLHFEKAHDVSHDIENKLNGMIKGAIITVHLEPIPINPKNNVL